MSEESKLEAVRRCIDELDAQIQTLISERARCAKKVGSLKTAEGAQEVVYYRPEREAQVLRRVKERNSGDLPADEMARIFREIMSACLALEQPLSVAYLGPEGTYTQAAVLKHFGHSVLGLPQQTIDDVFREVEAGTANAGVVPMENSTEGVVNRTLDMFLHSPVKICGEVELRIQHQLLGKGQELAEVRRVYGHQQALAQCREWLDTHLHGVEQAAVSSNAEAARRAAGEAGAAAVAGMTAAEIYQLNVLAGNVEDDPGNTTRFVVISRRGCPPSGKDKTSLLLSTRNQPGALYHLLTPLAKHGVSMTRIESRPSRREIWEYVFFVDVVGHVEDPPVAAALQALADEAAMLKVLGSYPCAVI